MQQNTRKGAAAALAAFFVWGLFPIYWKMMSGVPAREILAYRMFWSFVTMLVLVAVLKKTPEALAAWRLVKGSSRMMGYILAAGALISLNWYTFIWAVNDGRILDSSLGYYINPLVSVAIGMVFLGERLSRPHKIAVALAAAGVGYMTAAFGALPWVALTLAFTYGFYGLCKKLAGLDAISGMLLETCVTVPFAAVYLGYLHYTGAAAPVEGMTGVLLALSGLVTVVPLILFAYGANNLPLSMVALCQYITPTLSMLIGIFIYHEPFSSVQLVSFALIWTGLAVFSLPQVLALVKQMR